MRFRIRWRTPVALIHFVAIGKTTVQIRKVSDENRDRVRVRRLQPGITTGCPQDRRSCGVCWQLSSQALTRTRSHLVSRIQTPLYTTDKVNAGLNVTAPFISFQFHQYIPV